MTDNQENRRTAEDMIAAEIDRRRSKDAPRTMSPEQLEKMVADRHSAKRSRYLRTAGFAALFVIAVFGTAMLFNTFTTDVGADKNAKEEIRTEDGVVIEDGGYGGSSEDKVVITEWEEIETCRISNPQIVSLDYIPKGYTFDKMIIDNIGGGDTICEYIFVDKGNNKVVEIEEYIQNGGTKFFEMNDGYRSIECSKGIIQIQDENVKIATIQIDDGICISIWGNLTDSEIINIIEGILL